MGPNDILDTIARSIYSALLQDLPDIERPKYKSGTYKSRPVESEIELLVFIQTWGSTALGFGGMGGAAMTRAYTVVVQCNGYHAIYFGGRFAYLINTHNANPDLLQNYFNDLRNFDLLPVYRIPGKYPASLSKDEI